MSALMERVKERLGQWTFSTPQPSRFIGDSPAARESIKAVDAELERLHRLHDRMIMAGEPDSEIKWALAQIAKMEEFLITLAKRHNGMEW